MGGPGSRFFLEESRGKNVIYKVLSSFMMFYDMMFYFVWGSGSLIWSISENIIKRLYKIIYVCIRLETSMLEKMDAAEQ